MFLKGCANTLLHVRISQLITCAKGIVNGHNVWCQITFWHHTSSGSEARKRGQRTYRLGARFIFFVKVLFHEYPRHDPCRSIGFVSILYVCFALRSQRKQIIKPLTFEPTCDVISDFQTQFCKISGRTSRDIKYRFRVENRSSSLTDSRGAETAPIGGQGLEMPRRGAG